MSTSRVWEKECSRGMLAADPASDPHRIDRHATPGLQWTAATQMCPAE